MYIVNMQYITMKVCEYSMTLLFNFISVESFEFTSESGVFDVFQVPLYHGWLVDPQDQPTYDVVSKLSYNQLVEMVINNRSSTDPSDLQKGL